VNNLKVYVPARVLLVDDEHQQLELRAAVLRMAGFSVVTAQGPIEALSLATTIDELDVAIVDYEMPMMNGGVLGEHLKAIFPKLNIVLYSAAVAIPSCDLKSVDTFISKGDGVLVLLHHLQKVSAQITGTPRRADAHNTQYDNSESPPQFGRAEVTSLLAVFAATNVT
jgi:CheY-like chemotaxis protein